jgi:transketolase
MNAFARPAPNVSPSPTGSTEQPVHDALLMSLIARMTGDEKHEPSAFSTMDVIWVLYDRILRVTPAKAGAPSRDRFLLSKGHGPMAYYAVLAAKGFIDASWLDGFGTYNSRLGGHPDRVLVPGVEMSSGSLGHGLPMAVGLAYALERRPDAHGARTFCLVGDAELDEGSNHEAIALAGRLGLHSLHAVAIDNRSSTYGWPGGLEQRFAVEGWATRVVDGHDRAAIERAFGAAHVDRPLAVIAGVPSK